MPRSFAFALVLAALLPSIAAAHFPWITIDPKAGKHGAVKFYFEHGPKAGDGAYLDPFVERGQMWLQTADGEEAVPLKPEDAKQGKLRWWQAELTTPVPRAVDLYVKWGVYRYGDKDTLLHYYARNVDANSSDSINALSESKNLDIQLQPQWEGGKLQIRAIRGGEPMAGQEIKYRGPKVSRSYMTGDDGVAAIPGIKSGRHTFRTEVKLPDESGEFNGKKYVQVHHHSTLIMDLQLPE